MRGFISRVGSVIVGASFGIWATTVTGYSATERFHPWPYSWLWWIALAAAAGAVIWLIAELPPRKRTRRADFVLHHRGGEMWELERTGRLPAFELKQGDGIVNTSHVIGLMAMAVHGDIYPGEKRMVSMPNDTGCYVWLTWVEDGGRYVTKSVHVTPNNGSFEFRGFSVKPGVDIQT